MKPTLLVLAAGLGTRYGGLKQIDAIGPHGQTIIDYSIYDSLRAGFGKVVFVIRHCFEEAFRERVSSKFADFVEMAFTYQELESDLGDFPLPPDRERPWGTGHAVLVSRDAIAGPFAVVNADDFYGRRSLRMMADFLQGPVGANDYAMVGYTLKNTLSEHGTVARGVAECDENLYLRRIVERTKIEKAGDRIRYFDAEGTAHPLAGEEPVSMNLWGFQPSIFTPLQAQFAQFLRAQGHEKKAELYIPAVVDTLVTGGAATVRVLPSAETWFGVTYRADKALAGACIRKLIDEGLYPEKLWSR
ncbi:MAG: nucleotidyltransferase [Planctomycetes bacterium]|jgi:UTP-glucose-1-phosphate uridylyltransferase|nr:nucleotidyltransferase [Planctomycetota bacterium]